MKKQEFFDRLRNQHTHIGRTQKVNEESGIITYDTLVFEATPAGARWKTVSWYVLDEDSAHEAAYARQEPVEKSEFARQIDQAIAAKKAAGKWWTAKVEHVDEDERYADVRVSVATSTASQVEERLMRLKQNPEKSTEVVISRVVDRVKTKFFKRVFGSSDIVDTSA